MTISEFLFGPSGNVLFIAPLVGAAAIGAISSGLQSWSTGRMNKKSREFALKMWNKQNEYNKPINQRRRLEEAGLNPNLLYDNAGSAVAGQAEQPMKPQFDTPNIGAVGEALGSGLMRYYNAQQIKSGIEVNSARTEEIKQDTINKGIDAVNKAIKNSSDALDYKTKQRLFQNTIKTAEERLRNLSVNTEYTSGKNAREQRIIGETEEKLQKEVQNLEKQGKIMDEDYLMKRIDRILYQEYKVRPQDPIYYRVLAELLKNFGLNPLIKKFKQ